MDGLENRLIKSPPPRQIKYVEVLASPGGPIERWIDRETIDRWWRTVEEEGPKGERLRINSGENITVICLPIVPRITADFPPPLRVGNFQP